jgi:hypothetical protein
VNRALCNLELSRLELCSGDPDIGSRLPLARESELLILSQKIIALVIMIVLRR